jgi:hypothetical protein
MEDPKTVTAKIYRLTCANCGHPLDVQRFGPSDIVMLPHYDCDNPSFRIEYPKSEASETR